MIRSSEAKAYDPPYEKTCLRRFRPGPTQTGLHGYSFESSDLDSREIEQAIQRKQRRLSAVWICACVKKSPFHAAAHMTLTFGMQVLKTQALQSSNIEPGLTVTILRQGQIHDTCIYGHLTYVRHHTCTASLLENISCRH